MLSHSTKTSPLRKTRCSEPDKPCSLNRSVKRGNTKSESCSSKSSHSSKPKNTLSIHSKTSVSKSSSSKSLSNLGLPSSFRYSNAYYLSLNERKKTPENAQLVAKQAEERAKRQLKLLEKSFEFEKQKITEELNNYLDEALQFNPEKSHAVSEHEARSGTDSAVRSRRQATSNHQNCRANSLLSHSSCPSTRSTCFSETSDNKPFLIQNSSSNFIKPPIDKDIKYSIDQPSIHEIVTKSVIVHDHNAPFANSQQQPQLLETQKMPQETYQ